MTSAEHPQSWSDLPMELAGLVLCRLPAYSDRVRFGAVCHHWRFSSTQHRLPQPLPCLAFTDGTFVSLPYRESLQFHDSASYHSSYGEWFFFSRDGTCSLKNPFSSITLALPNLSCLLVIDEPVEIINGSVHVTPEGEMTQESVDMEAEMLIDKAIVCSMLLVAAIVDIGPLNTVAMCRPGGDSWFVSGLGSKGLVRDIVFYEGKLYVLDEFKDLLFIDVSEDNDSGNLSISRVERVIDSPSFTISFIPNGVSSVYRFLVESHGALLLVTRTMFGMPFDSDGCMSIKPVGIEFEVFEADFKSSQWVSVTSMGDDRLLFIGKRYSQSVCVPQYKLDGDMLKGNCIFFLDDGTCNWFWRAMPGCYSIYDMTDGRTHSPELSELLKDRKVPATWLFPQ